MSKIFVAVLLVTSFFTAAAGAAGGGGAEPMPGTNYTDMPSYHPRCPCPPGRVRYPHKHVPR